MSSSMSVALLRNFFQISIVKMVEELLKMDVSEDMSAANITDSIIPRAPTGMSLTTRRG